MKIIILAAGYGTRLYPLTKNLPKPLLNVCGGPAINFLTAKIDKLKRYFPVTQIRVVTNNRFAGHFKRWKAKYGIDAEIVNDGSTSPENRLGAIGDIGFAINSFDSDWLVLGGDNLFDDDLMGFIKFAYTRRPFVTVGLHDLGDKEKASHFGIVEINREKRIIKFTEKPQCPATTIAAACIYFMPAESLLLLKKFLDSGHSRDAAGKYIEWLIGQTNVFGKLLAGQWWDIGHKEVLARLNDNFEKRMNYELKPITQ
jgi:glucose-1-phosphate thymidylyltransferase